MIYFNKEGFLVDQTLDGNDSAVREGIYTCFNKKDGYSPYLESLSQLYVKNGLVYRCPTDIMPEGNEWNVTRDQIVPLVAGLYKAQYFNTAKSVLKATIKRCFFAQNFERDYPGSTKYPWPHKMKNGDVKDNGKWRLFDFADPFMPDQIGMLVLASRYYPMYFILPISYIWLFLSLLLCSKDLESEQNQKVCLLTVYGKFWMKLYKKLNPMWKQQTIHYWSKRNEIEYAEMIIKAYEKV